MRIKLQKADRPDIKKMAFFSHQSDALRSLVAHTAPGNWSAKKR
jgi:hypothetical protein